MPDGIVECLLNYAIESRLHSVRQSSRDFGLDIDRQTNAFGNGAGEEANRGNPTKIIENCRPKLMRISS